MDDPRFPDLRDNPEYLAAVDEGLAAADAGQLIPWEIVRRWLASWGTKDEPPPPQWPSE